jgi:TRAP-type C4-dicarboxylate transport system permease large subunit
VRTLLRHISIATVFRGVWAFTVAQCILLALLVAFPGLATTLPQFMK